MSPCVRAAARHVFNYLIYCAEVRYPLDEKCFESRAHQCSEIPQIGPLFLTGLNGSGKTKLITSIAKQVRYFCQPVEIEIGTFDVRGFELLGELDSASIVGLANRIASDPVNRPRNRSEAINSAKMRAYSSGVAAVALDELQFLSQSDAASTQITNLILAIRQMRVPLVICANFSLLHKLVKRNPEVRDRLWQELVVLGTERPGTPEARAVVSILLKEFGELIEPLGDDALNEIGAMTHCVHRKLISLIGIAVGRVLQKRGLPVRMQDIRKAYGSKAYAQHRAQVEILRSSETLPEAFRLPGELVGTEAAGHSNEFSADGAMDDLVPEYLKFGLSKGAQSVIAKIEGNAAAEMSDSIRQMSAKFEDFKNSKR